MRKVLLLREFIELQERAASFTGKAAPKPRQGSDRRVQAKKDRKFSGDVKQRTWSFSKKAGTECWVCRTAIPSGEILLLVTMQNRMEVPGGHRVIDERKVCRVCVATTAATQRNTTCLRENFQKRHRSSKANPEGRITVEADSLRHAQEAHTRLPN